MYGKEWSEIYLPDNDEWTVGDEYGLEEMCMCVWGGGEWWVVVGKQALLYGMSKAAAWGKERTEEQSMPMAMESHGMPKKHPACWVMVGAGGRLMW